MARLRSQVYLLLSLDSSDNEQIFEKKQTTRPSTSADEVTDAYVNGSSRTLTLPASGSTAVNLNGITNVKWLYIQSDVAVQVTLNGSLTPIDVTPQNDVSSVPQSLPGKFMLWTNNVTSISVANPSTTATAKVIVAFAGT